MLLSGVVHVHDIAVAKSENEVNKRMRAAVSILFVNDEKLSMERFCPPPDGFFDGSVEPV